MEESGRRFLLIGAGFVRNVDTVIQMILRVVSIAERLSHRKKEDSIFWKTTEKDVVGASDGGVT